MNSSGRTVHATVTCGYCSSANVLTLQNVNDVLEIRCSTCGSPLGKVADVLGTADPSFTDKPAPQGDGNDRA